MESSYISYDCWTGSIIFSSFFSRLMIARLMTEC